MKPKIPSHNQNWQTKDVVISSRNLAVMLLLSTVFSTLMLSILPGSVFIGLAIAAFTGWYFHPQIVYFSVLLTKKNPSEKTLLQKRSNTDVNNIKHFKQHMRANKQLSSRKRLDLTESANTEHETNNVLEFPLKPSSTRKSS